MQIIQNVAVQFRCVSERREGLFFYYPLLAFISATSLTIVEEIKQVNFRESRQIIETFQVILP